MLHEILWTIVAAVPPAAIFAYIFEKKRKERMSKNKQVILGNQNQQFNAGGDITVTPEQKTISRAESTGAILRKHLGELISCSNADNSTWGGSTRLVEVSEDNIATLFTPASYSGAGAFAIRVKAEDAEVTEIPHGSCPIRIRILQRHGTDIPCREARTWEEVHKTATGPDAAFVKGNNVFHASYSKPGSSERRHLNVYVSKDGRNWHSLEFSSKNGEEVQEVVYGNNVDISKKFASRKIDLLAEDFVQSSSGTGGGPFRLFVS
jgi:hypothetical protein